MKKIDIDLKPNKSLKNSKNRKIGTLSYKFDIPIFSMLVL